MFARNLAAFTEALGVENAPMILSFSTLPWPSDENRDQFIKALTGLSMRDVNANV